MQETLEGIVTEIDGEFAKIRPKRHTECGECEACAAPNLQVLAFNARHAAVGQNVEYVQAQGSMLTIAWVLFIQPLLAVFAGIGLGSLAAPFIPWPPVLVMTIGAFLLLGLTVAFAVWFDRRYKLNRAHFAKITAIVS